MVTNAGGGYSRWKDLAVTRWREDTTRDSWGTFCYLRDVASGESGRPPTSRRSSATGSYEAIFSQARAEFRRRDHDLDTHTEIAVSPEDDIELRRITITNRSRTRADHRTDQLRRGRAGTRPRRTRHIRRSATCSCRPRSCAPNRRSCARAGRARRVRQRPGCST